MTQPLVIPVAFDFSCEWCWIGVHQARRLRSEFGVEIEWRSYEMHPIDDPWLATPSRPSIPNRPETPSRFNLLSRLEGLTLPDVDRPRKLRTFNAHQAVAYFQDHHVPVDGFVEEMFEAFWSRGQDINEPETIEQVAAPFLGETFGLRKAIDEGRYLDRTVKYDAPAYKSGVFNVPTFWIGGERFAEQPYAVLREAVAKILSDPLPAIYSNLEYPSPPRDRPYLLLNMVETIDGKIITGERDDPVVDLGSKLDHQLMKRIESSADAVILGAQTLRAAKKSWNPQTSTRIVVTRSGDLPFDSCFFTGNPMVASQGDVETPEGVELLRFSDVEDLLGSLRKLGVGRLLLLGGSTLNAQMFERDLVDEIFVTIAPKIKLGKDTPTIADGNPLPRDKVQNYQIVEQHRVGDELFVRYRRRG